jgi:hypothetical protein
MCSEYVAKTLDTPGPSLLSRRIKTRISIYVMVLSRSLKLPPASLRCSYVALLSFLEDSDAAE